MVIFSAPWVVPIDRPVIADGSIVVAEDRIVEVGARSVVIDKYPSLQENIYKAVLMPGLVNGHVHLELAHLKKGIKCQPGHNFTDWINSLLEYRQERQPTRQQLVESFLDCRKVQHRSGVGVICDIGNDPLPEIVDSLRESEKHFMRLIEYLAPNGKISQQVLENIAQLSDEIRITAHAPYSTGPEVLMVIKKRCNRLGHIFSIHTAESPDEALFIQDGTSIFRDFLEARDCWDGLFPFGNNRFSSTIDYLDHLGILDETTLLVHCVHLSNRDLEVVKERGCKICLCPGSNKFLGVGVAPVESMLAAGLLPALGTDSIGSNELLNLWREMQLLALSFPQIEPQKILAMATEGGARGLGVYHKYGSLTVGKKARIIHVASAGLEAVRSEETLMKELVLGGQPTEVSWLGRK